MGGIVVDMVRTAMEAFARRDLALCMKLPAMDDPVDRLNRGTHLEALKLADDPRSLDWGLHMNMAARALERVGDNAVDIGEQVGFLHHGRVPRVHGRVAPGGRVSTVARRTATAHPDRRGRGVAGGFGPVQPGARGLRRHRRRGRARRLSNGSAPSRRPS